MAKVEQGQKTPITLDRLLNLTENAIMSRLNCHNVGKIISFNATNQTATIELMQVKQFKNRSIIPSLLIDVPLFIYGAGNAHITLPDPTGSICLLLFLDRNIDSFLETGEQYEPETGRMHDFSDCIALTTFKTLANPISNYDLNAITLEYQNSTIKVKDEISIDAKDEVKIKSVTKIVLDAPDVETTGNLSVATGYSGVIPCGGVSIQVTNGIITGVV